MKGLRAREWHYQGSVLERITLSQYAEGTVQRKKVQRKKDQFKVGAIPIQTMAIDTTDRREG